MTSTIEIQAKGMHMETIFDTCNVFSVRNFQALGVNENDYNPNDVYSYEVTIRHIEGTVAKKLFQKELARISK